MTKLNSKRPAWTIVFTLLFLIINASAATQQEITGPAGSGAFGMSVTVLTNGNIVVTDPSYDAPGPITDVGAVYLYDGASGALISTFTGSTASDQIGSHGVIALPGGKYVVPSFFWDNGTVTNAGAVTFCDGTTGCTGVVSAANSLVGSAPFDDVGTFVTVLTSGNYVVGSPAWDYDDGTTVTNDVGAVTWCSGTIGCIGAVSDSNSLVGSNTDDEVSNIGSPQVNGVTALTNGNYVVASRRWAPGDFGAVTFCDGTSGCIGPVSASNSLVGSSTSDEVGSLGVTALTNGNYVVRSQQWSNAGQSFAGAVTWCNGTSPGCTGLVSTANSLVGTQMGDSVGVGGVVALTNGNYVVDSQFWDDAAPDVGAVTFCSGTTPGCTGAVSAANSLVGSTENDWVGEFSGGGVTALTNGNYVVRSDFWDGTTNDVGAVTFCSGTTGRTGAVSASNSLVGSTSSDNVGRFGVFALSTGNYLVSSAFWDGMTNDIGAVTWCNGTTGCTGAVSVSNSLIGSTANDRVGNGGVTALSGPNYVVSSPSWDGTTNDGGAATFCNANSGCTGVVTASNSLVGSGFNDQVGIGGATALSNGNYVVRNKNWTSVSASDVGAATWCNGTTGCTGLVTASNSLIGSSPSDEVGNSGVTALSNGNYVVRSTLWNSTSPSISDVGAISLGAGNGGTVGPITAANSVLGASSGNGATLVFAADVFNGRLVVGLRAENKVIILRSTYTAVADGNFTNAATWDLGGAPTSTDDVVIPNGRTLTLNSTVTVNSVSVGCTGAISGGSASAYIIASVKKDYCAIGSFTYPIGTAIGYSPVDVNATALAINPSSLTIKANDGVAPPLNASKSLQRYWKLTGSGITADLTFNYLAGDVMGTEANYKVIRVASGTAVSFPASTVDTVNHRGTLTGVSSFSNWTMGEPVAPTAAPATISGTITSANGASVSGVVVNLSGSQSRKTITNADGFYRFDNVETGGFYTVTPSRSNYSFNPFNRSFSQLGNQTEAAFSGTVIGDGTNAVDTPEYFVRQHYLDFLNREPDESGFNFWSNQMLECGADLGCLERRRVNVSAAYFLSIEFQETGGLVDGLYRASYGRRPLYSEFMPDSSEIAHEVVVGRNGWQQQLETNKQTFIDAWVQRPAFIGVYGNLTNDGYVDQLIAHTGINCPASERDALVSGLTNGTLTRASALRRIVENQSFARAKFNEAFVMMQYFGYLRRDPDESGYQFWLRKLNEFNGNFEQAEMVRAFLISGEYRQRFVGQ